MLRREVVKAMGSLFGLGAGTPSRFPYPDRPQPAPGVGPSQGQVTRARVVIVSGPTGSVEGVFVYAPGTVPALGNPPIASLTAGTADPFGNPVKPQMTVYGTDGTFVEMQAGAPASLFIGSGDSAEATPARVLTQVAGAGGTRRIATTVRAPRVTGENAGAAASLVLESPTADLTGGVIASLIATGDGIGFSSLNLNQTQVTLLCNSGAQIIMSATNTAVSIGSFTSTQGTAANPSKITTDSWQSLGSPGIANVTVNAGRYAMMPFGASAGNMTCIDVALTVGAGGAAAGAYAFANTLPAAYQFPGNYSRSYEAGFNGTITTATNNADLLVDGAGTGTRGRVRLQIPALPAGTVISATVFIPLN